MKDDSATSSSGAASSASTAVATPRDTSEANSPLEPEGSDGSAGATTVQASESDGAADKKGKKKAPSVTSQASATSSAKAKDGASPSKDSNLVGKITNLVSTDLGNIVEGMVCVHAALFASHVMGTIRAGLPIPDFLGPVSTWSLCVVLVCNPRMGGVGWTCDDDSLVPDPRYVQKD